MQGNPHRKLLPGVTSILRWTVSALALLLMVPLARAAGLGSYEVQSSLGQALRIVVQITARADETIDPGCFKLNPYALSNDGLPQLTTAQLAVDKRGNAQRLIITSVRPVLDPIVRVAIDIGCDTTLRRDLTILLDPAPVIESLPQTAEPASPVGVPIAPIVPSAPGARPGATAAPGAAGRAEPAMGAGTNTAGSPASAAMIQPGSVVPPSAPRATGRNARADNGPDLSRPARAQKSAERQASDKPASQPMRGATQRSRDRLSISGSLPAEAYVGADITPRLNLSTTLSDRTGQAPLPDGVLSLLRLRQARLKAAPLDEDIPSLEAELVVLQRQTAEMRSQLAAAMAKLPAAPGAAGEAGTPLSTQVPQAPQSSLPAAEPTPNAPSVAASPDSAATNRWYWLDLNWIWALPLVLVLLALIAGFVLWLRREQSDARRADRWNKTPFVPAIVPSPPPPPPGTSFAADGTPESTEQGTSPGERQQVSDSYALTPFSPSHAARELGVSDLAQATEKASVFVTLGRPEQAIDVLNDHIVHEPKSSPMAWVMLLDLYRQTNRRSEFADVAQRFHLEFNAEAPEWDQPAQLHDQGMAAFPHLIRKIRDGWPKPAARTYIEELLYDNRGGSRIGFSLPAFRDLLLLHTIIDDYLKALAAPPKVESQTGIVLPPPPPPAPPPHLAKVWLSASSAAPPNFAASPPLQLDVGLLSESPDRSALEAGYPIIAEAVVSRWGKPGVAKYLGDLIRSTNEQRGLSLSNDTMAELIMLHDVAQELGEPDSGIAFA